MKSILLSLITLLSVPTFAQLRCGGLIRFSQTPSPVQFSVEERKVELDPVNQSFNNEQLWLIRGAVRAELMAARTKLTFTGKLGVIDTEQFQFLETNTPEELQNILGRVDVQKARPRLLPEYFGSRAQTFLRDYGMEISMSEGHFGNGGSRIIFGETFYDENGVPITPVREIGRYTVAARIGGVCAPFCTAANLLARFTPVGWMMSAPALKFMGELHNVAFNAGRALAAAVNVDRR